jgi:hypothetical protein
VSVVDDVPVLVPVAPVALVLPLVCAAAGSAHAAAIAAMASAGRRLREVVMRRFMKSSQGG